MKHKQATGPLLLAILVTFILPAMTAQAETADQYYQQSKNQGPVAANLPDFSYAGYFSKASQPVDDSRNTFNVTDYGAIADDNRDDSQAIQRAINAAEANDGGIVLLPSGTFDIQGGDEEHIIKITHSDIIMRGQDSEGDAATVLKLKSPSQKASLGVIGQVPDDIRSIATLSLEGDKPTTTLASFAHRDFKRGSRIIQVDSTEKLMPNQTIQIALTDREWGGNNQVSKLLKTLTSPFEYTGEETKTLREHGDHVTYITRIRRVIDETTIELFQPLRFDHRAEFSATIQAFAGLTNIGIENIRFESDWPGQFVHHEPYPAGSTGSAVIRSEAEQDYGWTALWATGIKDSWIANVVFANYTQNLVLSNSAFVTIDNVTLDGDGGHAGLTYSNAHSILAKNIHFTGAYAHPISLRAWTSGSVFTSITNDNRRYDPDTRTGPFIDFHGLYPYENLFENSEGLFVHSGGDLNVLPHSGVRNTFWNIQTPEVVHRFDYAVGEFFNTTVTQVYNMYRYHPASILVGVHGNSGTQIAVDRDERDRVTDMVRIYNLNRNEVPVPSLFNDQVAQRKQDYPTPPAAPNLLDNE